MVVFIFFKLFVFLSGFLRIISHGCCTSYTNCFECASLYKQCALHFIPRIPRMFSTHTHTYTHIPTNMLTHKHTHTDTETATHTQTQSIPNHSADGRVRSMYALLMTTFPVSLTAVTKKTRCPSFHILTRRVCPGRTGDAKRTFRARKRSASPSAKASKTTRALNPIVQSPCRMGSLNPLILANSCAGEREREIWTMLRGGKSYERRWRNSEDTVRDVPVRRAKDCSRH